MNLISLLMIHHVYQAHEHNVFGYPEKSLQRQKKSVSFRGTVKEIAFSIECFYYFYVKNIIFIGFILLADNYLHIAI